MRTYCFNIAVDDLSQDEALKLVQKFLNDGQQHYIVTPNPEIVLQANSDYYFRRALIRADLSLVDGYGLALALKLAGCNFRNRLTGADFLNALLRHFSPNHKFFFLGAEHGTAAKAGAAVSRQYGAKPIGTFEPPRGIYNIKEEIKIKDEPAHQALIKLINDEAPDFLIVALGHGQQEKWLCEFLRECPSVKVGMGVGGSLDYLANNVKRAPELMRRLGLEWLWRLANEPARSRRIFRATVIFPIKTLRWIINMKLKYRPLVVGCIINRQGEILLVERAGVPNHWQFPQGGCEPDETPRQAVRREMKEEIGTENLTIIGQSKPDVYRYRWQKIWDEQTDDAAGRRRYHGYAGQRVTVFYLKYDGPDDAIKVDKQELVAYRWVEKNKLLETIHLVRRPLAKIVLNDLAYLK